MLKRIFVPLIALSFAASAAFAQGKVSESDAKAMKNLADGELAEIVGGKGAGDRAHTPRAKAAGGPT